MENQSYKEFEIDGVKYLINMMPADQGIKVCTKLLKLIGEPLGEVISAQGDAKKVWEMIPSAIKSLTLRLEEDEVLSLAKTLCGCVTTVGSSNPLSNQFNVYFRGKYKLLFILLKEVAVFNFHDFLEFLPNVKANVGQEKTQA